MSESSKAPAQVEQHALNLLLRRYQAAGLLPGAPVPYTVADHVPDSVRAVVEKAASNQDSTKEQAALARKGKLNGSQVDG